MTKPTPPKHSGASATHELPALPSKVAPRPQPNSEPEIRRSFLPLLLLLTMILSGRTALASAGSSISASTPEAGPVLTLTNEHLGMSLEQIEASQADPVIEPAPAEADAASELRARADHLLAVAEAADQRALEAAEYAEALRLAVAAAEAGHIPGIAGNQQGPASYESCIEASVRRGLSLAESDRMCRVVFEGVAE